VLSESEVAALHSTTDETEITGLSVVVTVNRDEVPERVAALLQTLPVADLKVEDVSVEDVVRDLFSGETHYPDASGEPHI
jgi:ABC-type uncharacterized transport system ATPase subunit